MNENSEIFFMKCKTQSDATMFTSQARNLPQEASSTSPRLVMYVDQHALKWYKAMQIIAKSMRDHDRNIQTTIRTGKNYFLLRKRQWGDPTPWMEIPPVIIDQQLPAFEVGTYDIINPGNNVEPMGDDPDEIEGIDELANEIVRQHTSENKRERSQDEMSQGKNKSQKHRSNQTTILDGSSREVSENECDEEGARMNEFHPNKSSSTPQHVVVHPAKWKQRETDHKLFLSTGNPLWEKQWFQPPTNHTRNT